MKKNITKSVIVIFLALVLCISGCGNKTENAEETALKISETYSVSKNENFASIYLQTSIDEFLDAGFELGDSLNVKFSNGKKLEDVPFYNGFYAKINSPLVVAYPGSKYIEVTYSYAGSSWDVMELKAGDTAEVTLNESGKYSDIQESLSSTYTDVREQYGEDYVFANFRSMSGGTLKENTFYRGASAIDNKHNRAGTVDKLIREAGIKYILDLSDDKEAVSRHIDDNPEGSGYLFSELLKNNKVALLNVGPNFQEDKFKNTLATALKEMMKHEGPYYIHCTEGKDRSGFVAILFEALCGASYSELEKDYMITYDNYYGISKEKTPEKYRLFVDMRFDEMIEYLAGTDDHEQLMNTDLSIGAKNYLKQGGMTDEELEEFVKLLSCK